MSFTKRQTSEIHSLISLQAINVTENYTGYLTWTQPIHRYTYITLEKT